MDTEKYLMELEVACEYAAHLALPTYKTEQPHDTVRDARVAIYTLLASQ